MALLSMDKSGGLSNKLLTLAMPRSISVNGGFSMATKGGVVPPTTHEVGARRSSIGKILLT